MKIVIDIKEVASQLADDLQLNDRLLSKLGEGAAISGWSNAIIDILQDEYQLENLLVEELTQ